MTKKELIKSLDGIPDDAVLYVASDHAMTPERCSDISWTVSETHTYYGDELKWDTVQKTKSISTAFLIS